MAAVLGVAAVVCVSSAVAGEMLQDLKVGHILGGTPRKMQIGDFLGVLVASLALYLPAVLLHQATSIAAASVSAIRNSPRRKPADGIAGSQGIVGDNMPWPLIVVGVLMGLDS